MAEPTTNSWCKNDLPSDTDDDAVTFNFATSKMPAIFWFGIIMSSSIGYDTFHTAQGIVLINFVRGISSNPVSDFIASIFNGIWYVSLFMIIRSIFLVITKSFYLTTTQIVMRKLGLNGFSYSDVNLNEVSEMTIMQSPQGKLLNYGTVRLIKLDYSVFDVSGINLPIIARKAISDAVLKINARIV